MRIFSQWLCFLSFFAESLNTWALLAFPRPSLEGGCNSSDSCPKFLGLDKQTSSAKDCLTQHVKLKLASQRHEAAREVQQCRPYSQP